VKSTVEVPGQVTFQWEVTVPIPDPSTIVFLSVNLAIAVIAGAFILGADNYTDD
jgi:hypothetical protein